MREGNPKIGDGQRLTGRRFSHLCPSPIFGLLLSCIFGLPLLAADAAVVVLRGFTMGSTWSAKYRPVTNTPPERVVERALQARLDDLEQQMSTWRTDSVLSRFNASRATNWFAVSRDT
ncbi:MAG: hypothetical protein EBS05_25870, partial [Proteobacteria bacterium]|nr:hypothetical protein [Pseudomonadota bacterium]